MDKIGDKLRSAPTKDQSSWNGQPSATPFDIQQVKQYLLSCFIQLYPWWLANRYYTKQTVWQTVCLAKQNNYLEQYNNMYLYSTKMATGKKPQLHKSVLNQEVKCVGHFSLEETNCIYASLECQIRNMRRQSPTVGLQVHTVDAESAYTLATQGMQFFPPIPT